MKTIVNTPEELIATYLPERQEAMNKLRALFHANLPKEFSETIAYGMITYCVPHSIYPNGYHCKPEQALPFISIASQKNFIAIYHMGIYSDPSLLDWFTKAYKEAVPSKLDMGKSCIRFKKMDQIPYELIAELAGKMSVTDWVTTYERILNRN